MARKPNKKAIELTTFGVFTHFIIFVSCLGILVYAILNLVNTPTPKQSGFWLYIGLLIGSLLGVIGIIINMWCEICCCWPCARRDKGEGRMRAWVGFRNREERVEETGGLRGWYRRSEREEEAVRLGWLEKKRSQSRSGMGRDEEAGFGRGTGDWESRIERDEGIDTGSKAEERTLVGSEEGEGEGPEGAEAKEVWVAREGEEADIRGI